jgi:hypothetical protein
VAAKALFDYSNKDFLNGVPIPDGVDRHSEALEIRDALSDEIDVAVVGEVLTS